MELRAGKGGLHGAINSARVSDCYIIDIDSFYPSIMINNNLLPKCRYSKRFTELLQLKRDGMRAAKLLLNSVYGLCAEELRVSIARAGQDLMSDLISEAGGLLVQVNTDGIIVHGPNRAAVERWANKNRLQYTIKHVRELYQKDVNNYCYRDDDGNIIRKGTISKDNIVNKAVAAVLLGEGIDVAIKTGELIDYCEIINCDYYKIDNGPRVQADYLRVIHVTDGSRIVVDGSRVIKSAKEVNAELRGYCDDAYKLDYDYYSNKVKEVLNKWTSR